MLVDCPLVRYSYLSASPLVRILFEPQVRSTSDASFLLTSFDSALPIFGIFLKAKHVWKLPAGSAGSYSFLAFQNLHVKP